MRNKLLTENKNTVNVLFYFDGKDQYARPISLTWNEERYDLGGVQFWYVEKRKGSLVHHYTIGDKANSYSFQLALETVNLTWRLEKAEKLSSDLSLWPNQELVGAVS